MIDSDELHGELALARYPDRIRAHTASEVNDRLDRSAESAVQELSHRDSEEIGRRLDVLGREWTIDRSMMLFASVVGSVVLMLGLRGGRRWLHLLQVQLGFLGLHALVGWCPPAPIFRRLGFRSGREIEAERSTLRMLLRDRSTGAEALTEMPARG